MEILCANCQARLKIPDEKIPNAGRVTANCPKCNSPISFEKTPPDSKPQAKPEDDELDAKVPDHDAAFRDDDPFSLDFYERGAKLALLMLQESDGPDDIQKALEGLGYMAVQVRDAGEAISKMRFHLFDLLILSEGFDNAPWEQSPVLHYLNRLPMQTRRKSFLVLMGSEFTTMDRMTAFAMSANMVVNPENAHEMGGILKAALWNHETFYGGFMEIITDLGKG